MTPEELQANFNPTVLFYVYSTDDFKLYQIDLSDVGTVGYDVDGAFMGTWFLASTLPTNEVLQAFTLSTVMAYYNTTYVYSQAIASHFDDGLYQISTANLAATTFDTSFIGKACFDSTAQTLKVYNGSTWQTGPQTYLPRIGGALTGNLGLNTTSYGGGTGSCLAIANATANPSTNPSGGGILYVSAGALWYRGSSGTPTMIAPA